MNPTRASVGRWPRALLSQATLDAALLQGYLSKRYQFKSCRNPEGRVVVDQQERELIRVYRALGEPTRLAIVRLLAQQEEVGCAELAGSLDLTRPTLSYHTRILEESGLLQVRKEGAYRFYSLARETVQRLAPAVLQTRSSHDS